MLEVLGFAGNCSGLALLYMRMFWRMGMGNISNSFAFADSSIIINSLTISSFWALVPKQNSTTPELDENHQSNSLAMLQSP